MPFNIYDYNHLAYGWKNTSSWFQKIMNKVLQPYLGSFRSVYINNIITYSKTESKHEKHVAQALATLCEANLKVWFKKSEFFKNIIEFPGRVLDRVTKSTKQESVACISQLVKPYDVHSLKVFLSLTGQLRAFIKDYATESHCLTKLMQKD